MQLYLQVSIHAVTNYIDAKVFVILIGDNDP